MGLFQKDTAENSPHIQRERDFSEKLGSKDWAGPWELNTSQMIWWRPEHFYFKSPRDGITRQNTQHHMGPALRPGPLKLVGQHIDFSPLTVLRSHPDEPETLGEFMEGKWISTNPSWPEATIRSKIGNHMLIAADMPRDEVEEYELIPSINEGLTLAPAEAITPENSLPFDPTPLSLNAIVVYVRMRNQN